ncbi:salivary glue protein Sgs-3-like [Ixodes scapularis]
MALGENLEHSAPHQTQPMVPAEQTLPVSQPAASTTGFPESELTTTGKPEPTFMISTGGNLEHPAPLRPPVVVPTMPAVPVPSLPPQRLPTPPQPIQPETAPFFRPTEPAQTVVPAVPSQQPTEPPLPVVPTEPQVPPQPVVVPEEPAKIPHPVVPPHVVTDGYIRTIIQHDADDYGPFVPHKSIEELVVDEDDHLKQGSCGKCQRKLHYCVQKCFTQHSCEAETVLSCPRIDAPCFAPFEKEHDQCQVAADCEGVHHLCCLVGCSRKCVPGLLFPIGAHP